MMMLAGRQDRQDMKSEVEDISRVYVLDLVVPLSFVRLIYKKLRGFVYHILYKLVNQEIYSSMRSH